MFKKKIKNIYFKFFNKIIFLIGCIGLRRLRNTYKNITSLEDAELKIFSQGGDDGIIDYLLFSLNIKKPKFVEIGIQNYTESNTKFLYDRTSAKGLIIDIEQNLTEKVKMYTNIWKGDLKILEREINSDNINSILYENNFSKELDLFSIDIDGVDYWVINELNQDFSKIVVCEYNSVFGADLKITVPNLKKFNRTNYHYSNLCFGASLKALIELLASKNFIFLGCNLLRNNAYFISKKYSKKIHLNFPDLENISMYTDSNLRESRKKNNRLNYLSGRKKIEEIYNCEVFDLASKKIKKIKELFI